MLLALLYAVLRLLIDLLIIRGRPAADRDLKLLVLRQELLVLRRTARRPRWRRADRMILAALGRRLPAAALLLVQPATILGWHRALVRRRWAAFGRRQGPGRPPLPAECQELVLRLARENPRWGYRRIQGEALKLGFRISHMQVARILRSQRIPPAPRRSQTSWRELVRQHAEQTLATDFFTVETAWLQRLYVVFFVELASRKVHLGGISASPTGEWVAQQARNLTWKVQDGALKAKFLLRDRDSKFTAAFDQVFRSGA